MTDEEEDRVDLGVVPARLIDKEQAVKLLQKGHLLVKAEMDKDDGSIVPQGITEDEAQAMASNYAEELLEHTDATEEEVGSLLG